MYYDEEALNELYRLLGSNKSLYIYSNDILCEGSVNETSLKESAIAQALKEGVGTWDYERQAFVNNAGNIVEFAEANNSAEFESAIEQFYNKYGTIDKLTVSSHMTVRRIDLNYGSDNRSDRVYETNLGNIDAAITNVLLLGCDAGVTVPLGKNIAQSFADTFIATVTAANSGTWNGGGSQVYERNGKWILYQGGNGFNTLIPNGGSWVTYCSSPEKVSPKQQTCL